MDCIGVYLRISDDKDGTQTATERQLEDCTRYAANQGWDIVDVFQDVDLSAYKRNVTRPEFERMLMAVKDGEIGGVLAWKIDRISRRQRDLVRLDEELEEAGGFIATVVEGIDTRKAEYRFVSEMLVAMARMESQNMSTRVARANESMAEAGLPSNGGHRAFGYSSDRKRIIPEEAELIKEAERRLLDGEGIRRICLDWEERGITSPTGKPWKQGPLRRLLANPMLSAQRIYKGLTIAGKWPAILTERETARLRLLLLDPARRKMTTNSRSYLLSGFLRCGRCGVNLVARPTGEKVRRYVCARQPGRGACGKLARVAEPVEETVTEMVFVALEDADLSGFVRGRERKNLETLQQNIRDDETALEALAQDFYVDRIIERGEFLSARDAIEKRLAKNRARAADDRRHGVLGELMAGAKLRELWPTKSLDWKRAVLGVVLDHVVIEPAQAGRNKFDPTKIKPVWRF
jgi:site-specific DNA recombinase